MTEQPSVSSPRWRPPLGVFSLTAASVLFTLGFACAAPLAAFAAIAAMAFSRRDALVATAAIWLANQGVGFAFLHYPTDGVTLAWGGALGVIASLGCEAAGLVSRRTRGFAGAWTAFFAAFVIYEGSLSAIDIATGQSGDDFALATVARIFLINACAFSGLWALKTLAATMTFGRKVVAGLAPHHV